MKKPIIIITTLLAAAGMAWATLSGSATAESEADHYVIVRVSDDGQRRDTMSLNRNVDIADFTKISVTGPVTVCYSPTSKASMSVSADGSNLDRVSVKVVNRELQIRPVYHNRRNRAANNNNNNNNPIIVNVTSPTLNAVTVSTAANFECKSELRSESTFSVSGTSAGSVKLVSLRTPRLKVGLNSASSLEISRLASDYLDVNLSSAASVSLPDAVIAENSKFNLFSAASAIVGGKSARGDLTASSSATILAEGFRIERGAVSATSCASIRCWIVNPSRIHTSSYGSVRNKGDNTTYGTDSNGTIIITKADDSDSGYVIVE